MTRIILDADLRNRLQNLAQPLELCDDSGQILGHVFPAQPDLMSQYEPWEPPISEEELQRRERSDQWYTTAEVLAHLEKLDVSAEVGSDRPE